MMTGSTAAYCGTGCQSQYGKCYGRSAAATANGAGWTIGNIATFTKRSTWNFAGLTSLPAGLVSSNYLVTDMVASNPNARYNHFFSPSQVSVGGGYLNLKVPGGQTTSPLQSAEVGTCAKNILYASVRIIGIMGNSAGTVCGT